MNSRSTVHEYGGGDFCPLPNSNSVLTINHTSKNIKLLNHSDHASVDVTPSEDELFRYGDISTDPLDRGYLYAVREDHSIDIPSKVVNCVVAIPFPTSAASLENWNFSPVSSQTVLTNEEQNPSIMYSSPSVDPSGKLLCWMEWSHPNMPWNESSLYVGLLSPDGARVVSKLKIAGLMTLLFLSPPLYPYLQIASSLSLIPILSGGPQESVHHPRWVPSTRAADELCLIYISDKDNGWWNIHRTTLTLPSNLSSSSSSTLSDLSSVVLAHSPVLIADDYEFGRPQWNLGNKYFDFLVTKTENGDDSCRLVCMWHDQTHTMHAILCSPYQTHTVSTTHTAASDSATTTTDLTILPVPLVPASSPQSQPTKLTICNSLQVAGNSTLVILSGSAVVPLGVYRWDLSSPDSICLIQSSVPLDSVASIPSSYLSIPQHISFPTYSEDSGEGDAMSYGWFYPPTHPTHAPDGIPSSSFSTLPPLLVKCHGGPTGSTSTEYRLDIQYFTSRGIAVLDVDYSGSSGYGRQYRERLNQKWGIYDRKDCVFGVKYLVTRGLVDEQRVAIDGSSAGGYTTLAAIALEEEKVFTAATSAYGLPPFLLCCLTSAASSPSLPPSLFCAFSPCAS
jgi:hypothetical protein